MGTKILVVICLALLASFGLSLAEEPKPASDASGVGASGAAGSTAGASGARAHVSAGSGSGGYTLNRPAGSSDVIAVELQRHPLSCPQTFDKDGVYIWCDPDGVWTIFWCGRRPFELVAHIASQAPISIKSSGGPDTEIIQPADELLEISGRCGPQPGIVQFSCASPEMEFKVLVDQKPAVDLVYLGAQGNSPLASSFTLQTRREVVAEPLRGRNRPTAPTASDAGVKPQAEISGKAPSLSSGQHGGGERNGSPRGKNNQGGE